MIIWCMLTQIWSVTDIFFCHFRSFFALLSHYWPRKLKFGKNIKTYLEILSFYTYIPLIKIIWCMVLEIWRATDRIYLSSWVIFCTFTPLTAWKMKMSEMKKNPGDIIILHWCTKNIDHSLYCSRDKARDRCNCYFHFGLYFFLLPPSP